MNPFNFCQDNRFMNPNPTNEGTTMEGRNHPQYAKASGDQLRAEYETNAASRGLAANKIEKKTRPAEYVATSREELQRVLAYLEETVSEILGEPTQAVELGGIEALPAGVLMTVLPGELSTAAKRVSAATARLRELI